MEEGRGEWSRYYPLVLILIIIATGIGAGLATYVREQTGTWMSYLISPLIGTALIAFLLINRRRFDAGQVICENDKDPRCVWCGKRWPRDFCSEGCENCYRRYERILKGVSYPFIVCLFIPVVLMVMQISEGVVQLVTGLILAISGAAFLIFPSAMREGPEAPGIRKVLVFLRIFGLMLMIGGIAMIIYAPPL